MSTSKPSHRVDRRDLLRSGATLGGAMIAGIRPSLGQAPSALLKVETRTIEVANKAATVYRVSGPGYRCTINGRIHGEHTPIAVRQGERVQMTFMNPTSMMHSMHLRGHHFQVTAIAGRAFSGAVRDTVDVPPHVPVTIAFDAALKGSWYLHCHHIYHMATGMMTEVRIV